MSLNVSPEDNRVTVSSVYRSRFPSPNHSRKSQYPNHLDHFNAGYSRINEYSDSRLIDRQNCDLHNQNYPQTQRNDIWHSMQIPSTQTEGDEFNFTLVHGANTPDGDDLESGLLRSITSQMKQEATVFWKSYVIL